MPLSWLSICDWDSRGLCRFRRDRSSALGDSGAGKSTLGYACARAGWTYVTDDASFLVLGREDSLVVGNARQARFRSSAEELFPELEGRPTLQRAGTGKPSVELCTSQCAYLKTSFSTPARYVVFLNRHSDEGGKLLPLAADVARAYIFQRGVGIPEAVASQVDAVERLLARGVFELHYSNLDWAIDRLARLAQDGR